MTIYVRHSGGRHPDDVYINLLPDGSAYLWELCQLAAYRILGTTPEEIIRIVDRDQWADDSKRRFEILDRDGTPRARACQGI